MARLQIRYICQKCGHETLRWLGRCPECEAWDSFAEDVYTKEAVKQGKQALTTFGEASTGPQPITEIKPDNRPRISSGIAEFDRVLGGGLVPGGVTLVGGDPGIGKSTLLTQAAHRIAISSDAERSVLYISGEESAHQIALRSNRLGVGAERFLVSTQTDVRVIINQIESCRPTLAIIDSIQTLEDTQIDSSPGSVTQVRASAALLTSLAKRVHIPIVLIGHVTKEGNLAGPRVLEHMVDTVLTFEGDRQHAYRLLRAVKNRFGSTDELGIFEMHEQGLSGVENPSALLLSERPLDGSGSAVLAALEGSRALLVEVQALSTQSYLATPRRVVNGSDLNRVSMLLAVLEKRLGLKLANQDVFVNLVGGVRVVEPAADLAVALAIASSFRDQAVEPHTLLIGEVGLAGELRSVGQIQKRLNEGAQQGFARAVIPRSSSVVKADNIQVIMAETVADAMRLSLQPPQR